MTEIKEARFPYLNHEGKFRLVRIDAARSRTWWGSTPYHMRPQLLLNAWDLDRGAYRDYAVEDIGKLPPAPAPHEVAEAIAKAIAPRSTVRKIRATALQWAADVAIALYPRPKE